MVLNNLFKMTQLQTSFAINMVALVDGRATPGSTCATPWWRTSPTRSRSSPGGSQFRLDKAQRREHILEGRIKALDVIDDVIALIRSSDDVAAARQGLMAEPFEFSEIQANDILDMQLRQLTRLSRIDLEDRTRERA